MITLNNEGPSQREKEDKSVESLNEQYIYSKDFTLNLMLKFNHCVALVIRIPFIDFVVRDTCDSCAVNSTTMS